MWQSVIQVVRPQLLALQVAAHERWLLMQGKGLTSLYQQKVGNYVVCRENVERNLSMYVFECPELTACMLLPAP
jgi:hypothetical protein